MITVWLEEEYGYRYWRWETHMSHEELVSWWSNLESVRPYFLSPTNLPGTVVQLDPSDWDKGTLNISGGLPEDFKPEDYGLEEAAEAGLSDEEILLILARPRTDTYWAHLHEDEDSVLRLPGKNYVYHKGTKS